MKRYFVETNADSMVAFVDDSGKAYIYNETAFDKPLTLDVAKSAAYENAEGCETAEEIMFSQGTGEVYDWALNYMRVLRALPVALMFAGVLVMAWKTFSEGFKKELL